MNTFKKTVLALSGTTLGALLLAGSVQATPVTPVWAAPDNGQRVSQSVSYADLNLSTAAGVAALHGRIEQAAREICGSTEYGRAGGIREASRNARCRKEAVAEALRQIPTQSVAGTN